jgi:hypothetical protein
MKKAAIAIFILLGFLALFYLWSTQRCKSLAKGAAGRVGYSFRDGCYLKLFDEKVPLR